MRISNIGLQRRVIAYAVVGLTVLVAIFAYVALDAVDESSDAILRERLILATTVANSIDQTIVTSEALVRRAAADLAMTNPERDALSAESLAIVESLSETLTDINAGAPPQWLALIDSVGQTIWHTGSLDATDLSVAEVEILKTTDTPLLVGAGSEGSAIAVGSVLSEGDEPFLLAAVVQPSGRLLSLVSDADAELGEYRLELLDDDGTVVVSSAGENGLTLSRHLNVVESLAAERSGGVEEHSTADGEGDLVDHIVAFAPLETVPWGVVLEQREDAALGLPNSLRRRVFIIAAVGLVGSLALAWITSRQVVRPLTRLTARARVIAGGDLSGVIPQEGQDEIRTLAESFETMRGRLETSQQELSEWSKELEGRVADRTAQLEQRDRERDVLLGKVISAQEEERRRIARDLHDQIGQTLTGLVMRLGTAEATMSLGSEAAKQELESLRESASDAVEEVRRMMSDLRPSLLDDMGLESAVSWYAETNLERAGVTVSLKLPASGIQLTPNLEIGVFRVFQEAITNVVKHADASNAWITLTDTDGCIRGEIRDDGQGFDTSAVEPGAESGWAVGLLGMSERISLLGGKLQIESNSGEGTAVTFEIPRGEAMASE